MENITDFNGFLPYKGSNGYDRSLGANLKILKKCKGFFIILANKISMLDTYLSLTK